MRISAPVPASVPPYFKDCADFYQRLDPSRVPHHIAIIMDGNGRWSSRQGFKRVFGHEHARAGVRESVRACGEIKIKVLSLFAFSTENWSRPKEEIEFLLDLFRRTLNEELAELKQNNVRLMISGERSRLPNRLNECLDQTMAALKSNNGLILNLAVNYGGKQDIMQAFKKMQDAGCRMQDITEQEFRKFLYTGDLPDVDLLIRTSGEQRLSNFFLWQAAYAELYFTPVLWPDFRREHLLEAVFEYQKRARRFGGL